MAETAETYRRFVGPPVDRVLARLSEVGECWEFNGARNANGYGVVWSSLTQQMVLTHRVMYEHVVGLIPRSLELDHACRNHACCRPEHLEPVTHRENMRRGHSYWAARTHCSQGHRYTPQNTIRAKNGGKEFRRCRTCKNAEQRRRRAGRLRAA